MQDETYLYCWNGEFIGTLPSKPKNGLRSIHGNEVEPDVVRLLICEKKTYAVVIEVGKQEEKGRGNKIRARWYRLDLNKVAPFLVDDYENHLTDELKFKILCGRMY